jgi:hypothetical protein
MRLLAGKKFKPNGTQTWPNKSEAVWQEAYKALISTSLPPNYPTRGCAEETSILADEQLYNKCQVPFF